MHPASDAHLDHQAPQGGRAPESRRAPAPQDPQDGWAAQAAPRAPHAAHPAQGPYSPPAAHGPHAAPHAPREPYAARNPHASAPHGGEPGPGTPPQGVPAYGTPPRHTPPQATPPSGVPVPDPARDVRGGHPEQHEPGGGWGAGPYAAAAPRQPAAPQPRIAQTPPRIPGPRREFLEAFDEPEPRHGQDGPAAAPGGRATSTTAPGGPRPPGAPEAPGTGASGRGGRSAPDDVRDEAWERGGQDLPGGSGASAGPAGRSGRPARADAPDGDGGDDARGSGRVGRGRTLTGIAAAAVTTVLAVIVAGQVGDARQQSRAERAADASDRGADTASRSELRATPQTEPSRPAAEPPTYEQLMARQFPLDPAAKGVGAFTAVPGTDPAPGKGRKIRYRVDVEKGLALDGALFATAVQKTLNDDRSWAHGGAMTFERISTGMPDFVITLASPGTTGVWCAKSGLDTTIDNVSCDSASTDRVMINAYRWAQGAETFGPKAMHAYRQMLINHEVGHRLGHNHRICRTPGAPAPVMQQQTKSLEIDGVRCRPNPWVFPGG
ncbi:DUF3152 domain-containing protein [Streptomyces fradiae]|uniref:DUF3152 domain-containing protein n=1 Tax=Streptomyces fradiae TaxID=1906 RepID=UPI003F4D3593